MHVHVPRMAILVTLTLGGSGLLNYAMEEGEGGKKGGSGFGRLCVEGRVVSFRNRSQGHSFPPPFPHRTWWFALCWQPPRESTHAPYLFLISWVGAVNRPPSHTDNITGLNRGTAPSR